MAHQQALAARLGCQARIAKVSTPRPGTTLYEQVELWDADTREPLARLPYVEVRILGTTVTVSLPYPGTINGARLDAFWQLARDQVREAADWRELHFEAQHLTLHSSAGDDQTLSDLDGQVLTDDDHSQLTMSFRRASGNAAAGRPAQLTITRQRQGTTPVCRISVHDGRRAVGLLAAGAVLAGGREARKTLHVRGHRFGVRTLRRVAGRIEGRLAGVDLDLLMSGFPHKLSGEGLVQLDRVVVRQGRIESAVGRLSAGPGQFSRSLADAAQANLPLKATIDRVPGGSVLHYQRLNLAFEASPLGLSLRGETAPQRGAVLVDDQDRVLVQEMAGRVPVVNLVRCAGPAIGRASASHARNRRPDALASRAADLSAAGK